MINNGDLLGGRYEVDSRIGQGGMSCVYKARDLKLDRYVALKVLKEEFSGDEEFVLKFRQEAKSVASLVHPNIVAAYDAVDDGDLHYIVMELVEGRSLKHRIQHRGPLSGEQALEVAIQTAEGIAAAHKNGIIHRDIKPQNILLSRDGTVKVADFGIAKAVTGETISTAILGSAHYVSPEQAKKGTSDARSDIYSFGITLYETVTGTVPFDGDNTVAVVMAHINQKIVPPIELAPSLSPALNDIILKAVKKNPAERYQTAEEMLTDLRRCREDPEGDFVFRKEDPSAASEAGKPGSESGGHRNSRTAAGDQGRKNITLVNKKFVALMTLLAAVLFIALLTVFIVKEEPRITAGTEQTSADAELSGEISQGLTIDVTEESSMPRITGRTKEEAMQLLNEAKLSLSIDQEEYNDIYLAGIIMSQTPEEGEAVRAGDTVHATVSLGSRLDSVLKELKGLTVDEAVKRLAGVEVSVLGTRKQFSEDVEEGLVIGYLLNDSPEVKETAEGQEEDGSKSAAGSGVRAGSSLILLVSAGREADSIHMPSLIGIGLTEAEAVLNGNGLTLGSVARVPEGTERTGQITAQSIQPNELVKKGTAVNVQANLDPGEESGLEETDPDDETLSPDYWYGSIDREYEVGTSSGPSGASEVLNLGIRLKQQTDDGEEYFVLFEPKPIASGTRIPVSYRNIRGVSGIDRGTVEVYDADTDTVLMSEEIEFHPLDQ